MNVACIVIIKTGNHNRPQPSTNNHKPPANNCKPPVNDHKPPVNDHIPPANKYKLPANDYKPHQKTTTNDSTCTSNQKADVSHSEITRITSILKNISINQSISHMYSDDSCHFTV